MNSSYEHNFARLDYHMLTMHLKSSHLIDIMVIEIAKKIGEFEWLQY